MRMWVSTLLHVGVTLLLQLLLHPVVPVLRVLGLGIQVDPAGLLRGRDRGDHHLMIGGRRHGDRRCDGSQVGQVHGGDLSVLQMLLLLRMMMLLLLLWRMVLLLLMLLLLLMELVGLAAMLLDDGGSRGLEVRPFEVLVLLVVVRGVGRGEDELAGDGGGRRSSSG